MSNPQKTIIGELNGQELSYNIYSDSTFEWLSYPETVKIEDSEMGGTEFNFTNTELEELIEKAVENGLLDNNGILDFLSKFDSYECITYENEEHNVSWSAYVYVDEKEVQERLVYMYFLNPQDIEHQLTDIDRHEGNEIEVEVKKLPVFDMYGSRGANHARFTYTDAFSQSLEDLKNYVEDYHSITLDIEIVEE